MPSSNTLAPQTKQINFGTQPIKAIYAGSTLIWPKSGGNWSSPGTVSFEDQWNKTFPSHNIKNPGHSYDVDPAKNGFISMLAVENLHDASKYFFTPSKWVDSWNEGTAVSGGRNAIDGHADTLGANNSTLQPTTSYSQYPIKEVRIATFDGSRYKLTVEVDVDPTKLNGGELVFTGFLLPRIDGTDPRGTVTQSHIDKSSSLRTYVYTYLSPGPKFILERMTYPGTSAMSIFNNDITNLEDKHYTYGLALCNPPSVSTLFNWPLNYMLWDRHGGYAFGDSSLPQSEIRFTAENTPSKIHQSFDDAINAQLAPYTSPGDNTLKLSHIGGNRNGYPDAAKYQATVNGTMQETVDLFDLTHWG